MKPIKLKDKQVIGSGAYGAIYRISSRRVVKCYFAENSRHIELLIDDELQGSKEIFKALPVLKVVEVIPPGCKKPRKALLKRYIPKELHVGEWEELCRKDSRYIEADDSHIEQYMKDTRGRVYRVDTQKLADDLCTPVR